MGVGAGVLFDTASVPALVSGEIEMSFEFSADEYVERSQTGGRRALGDHNGRRRKSVSLDVQGNDRRSLA